MKPTIKITALACAFGTLLTGLSVAQDTPKKAEPKLEAIAERAYLYGLQQAIYYGQRWTYTYNDNEKISSMRA